MIISIFEIPSFFKATFFKLTTFKNVVPEILECECDTQYDYCYWVNIRVIIISTHYVFFKNKLLDTSFISMYTGPKTNIISIFYFLESNIIFSLYVYMNIRVKTYFICNSFYITTLRLIFKYFGPKIARLNYIFEVF